MSTAFTLPLPPAGTASSPRGPETGTLPGARRLLGAAPASRRAVVTLLAEERQVGEARRFAAAQASRWGLCEEDLDTVVLVVGELTANAARHGGASMTVSLCLSRRDLCVDVVDSGAPGRPRPVRPAAVDDEHGRGLGIVEQLARWTDFRAGRDGWHCRAGLRVSPPRPEGRATWCR